MRCDASRSMRATVLILRDARTPFRLWGTASACALLRMRTAELAARRRSVFGNSHLTMSNSPSRSRGAFASGVCNFASPTPNEGWAERRETFRCSAEHPWGTPSCVKDARERAYDAAYQALARRLASHDAGRSPLGAPPWRFWASGPRFRLLGRPPSYNGGHLPSDPCSELLAARS